MSFPACEVLKHLPPPRRLECPWGDGTQATAPQAEPAWVAVPDDVVTLTYVRGPVSFVEVRPVRSQSEAQPLFLGQTLYLGPRGGASRVQWEVKAPHDFLGLDLAQGGSYAAAENTDTLLAGSTVPLAAQTQRRCELVGNMGPMDRGPCGELVLDFRVTVTQGDAIRTICNIPIRGIRVGAVYLEGEAQAGTVQASFVVRLKSRGSISSQSAGALVVTGPGNFQSMAFGETAAGYITNGAYGALSNVGQETGGPADRLLITLDDSGGAGGNTLSIDVAIYGYPFY